MNKKRRLIYGSLIAFGVLLLMIVWAVYIFIIDMQEKGGPASLVEASISRQLIGASVSVDDASFNFSLSRAPLQVIASDISIATGNSNFMIPDIVMRFGIKDLVLGSFVPSEIQLKRFIIDIDQSELEQAFSASSLDILLSALSGVEIEDAEVRIASPDGEVLSVPMAIRLEHTEERFHGSIFIDESEEIGSADIEFTSNNDFSNLEVSADLEELKLAKITPYLGIDIPRLKELEITEGQVAFSYQGDKDALKLSSVDVSVKETPDSLTRLEMSGTVNQLSSDMPSFALTARTSDLDIEEIKKVSEQLKATLKSGTLTALTIEVEGSLDKQKQEVSYTNLVAQGETPSVAFETRFSSAEQLSGTLGGKFRFSSDSKGNVKGSFSASSASLTGLPYGLDLTNGVLDLDYTSSASAGERLQITGEGEIIGAKSSFTIRQHADGVSADIQLAKSASLTHWLDTHLPLISVSGASEAVIAVRADSRLGDDIEVKAMLDLTDSAIEIETLGANKPKGESAHFSVSLGFEGGVLTSITDIDLIASMRAKGDITLDESGSFLGAYFERAAWGQNRLSNMTVERNSENILAIKAEAESVDLTLFRGENNPGEGVSLEVELIAERVIIDEDASFSGTVIFSTDEEGSGEAELLGSLFLRDKPFMTESSLRATFGGGADVLEGRGLIGKAEAGLTLSQSEEGGEKSLTLRSNNAGQILKTLGITNTIRGGRLQMVVEFDPLTTEHYQVHAELNDFNVIEAPAAVRFFSVLSIAGMYSILEGEGTHFAKGYADIEVSPERRILHQIKATGGAIAVDLIGVIETDTRNLEVSGVLVPLHGISEIIGQVPIFNQLLTGVDNQGVFATQFSITGTIDEPNNRINPSSIAPGLFRNILSPNWVSREYTRLIGDNTTETHQQTIDQIIDTIADNPSQ